MRNLSIICVLYKFLSILIHLIYIFSAVNSADILDNFIGNWPDDHPLPYIFCNFYVRNFGRQNEIFTTNRRLSVWPVFNGGVPLESTLTNCRVGEQSESGIKIQKKTCEKAGSVSPP